MICPESRSYGIFQLVLVNCLSLTKEGATRWRGEEGEQEQKKEREKRERKMRGGEYLGLICRYIFQACFDELN